MTHDGQKIDSRRRKELHLAIVKALVEIATLGERESEESCALLYWWLFIALIVAFTGI